MIRLLLSLLWISSVVAAPSDTRSYIDKHFDIAGYVGYKMVIGSVDTDPIDSTPELGLLINYNITDNFSAFTQFRYDTEYFEESLAYAFLKYNQRITTDISTEISIGKLRHHYGLYNKDRTNPNTRPGVVSPQAIYWDKLKFALTSGWGVSLKFRWQHLHVTYTIDKPVVVDPILEGLTWTGGRGGKLEPSFGGHQLVNIDYIQDDWRIVGAVAKHDWGIGRYGKSTIWSLGAERYIDDWTLSIEGLFIEQEDWTSHAYSATIEYDINDLISVHTNFNRYKVKFKDKQPFFILDHAIRANDGSVGLTIHKNDWELKLDAHAVYGSVWIDITKASNSEYNDVWYYGAASLVYHF